MKPRGKRMALLIAGALPLLAEEDGTARRTPNNSYNNATAVCPNTNAFAVALTKRRRRRRRGSSSFDLDTAKEQSPRKEEPSHPPPPWLFESTAFCGPLEEETWAQKEQWFIQNESNHNRVMFPFRHEYFELLPSTSAWHEEIHHETTNATNTTATNRTTISNVIETNSTAEAYNLTLKDSLEPEETQNTTISEESSATTTEESSATAISEASDDASKKASAGDSKAAAPKAEAEKEENIQKHVAVDYASKSVGALILDSSPNLNGASNLLQKDRDKYMIVPCQEPSKYVVVGLSEDILVKQIVLANYERYSSHMREIQIYGSTDTNNYVDLGTYVTTQPGSGAQVFGLTTPTWARYLKFKFLSHYGDEHYCTVSQISVHGSTMLQGFHEQWAEEEEEENDDLEEEEEELQESEQYDDEAEEDTANLDSAEDKALPKDLTRKVDKQSVASDALLQTDLKDENSETTTKKHVVGTEISGKVGNDSLSMAATIAPILESCVSQSNGVCPWDFEHKMSLISAGNVSDIDHQVGVLSSASICLSSSHPANRSFSATTTNFSSVGRRLQKAVVRARRTTTAREKTILVALSATTGKMEHVAANDRSRYWIETPPIIIERIKELIRSTAGAISVDEIGDTLFSKFPTMEPADAEVAPSGSSSSLSDETAKRDHPILEDAKGAAENKARIVNNKVPEVGEKPRIVSQETVKRSDAPTSGDVVDDSLHQSGLALAKVLQGLPNSKCLEKLNFADFKASVSKHRAGGNGGTGGGTTAGSMEPIFKKLTDEIRALQANVAVHDAFANESIACYQKVLTDLLLEMELRRSSQDARLSKLEHDLQLVSWIVAIQRAIETILRGLVSTLSCIFAAAVLAADYVQINIFSVSLGLSLLVICLFLGRLIGSIGHEGRKKQAEAAISVPIVTPEQRIQAVTPNTPSKNEKKSEEDERDRDRYPALDSTDQSESTPTRWKLKRLKKIRRPKNNTAAPE